jgi:hypothetical protein
MIPTISITTHGIALAIRVRFDPSGLCPVTGNPQQGSTAELRYEPAGVALKPDYIRAELRRIAAAAPRSSSMEEVFALLTLDCAEAAGVPVELDVVALLHDGSAQQMTFRTAAQL